MVLQGQSPVRDGRRQSLDRRCSPDRRGYQQGQLQRQRQQTPHGDSRKGPVCRLHKKFGAKANFCTPPCNWSENWIAAPRSSTPWAAWFFCRMDWWMDCICICIWICMYLYVCICSVRKLWVLYCPPPPLPHPPAWQHFFHTDSHSTYICTSVTCIYA